MCRVDRHIQEALDAAAVEAGREKPIREALSTALARWTGQRDYRQALAAGGVRIGLDDEPQGEVSEAERLRAAERLEIGPTPTR